MLKRLLVGIAGSPSIQSKIETTVALAKHHGAAITLMSIVDTGRLEHLGMVPMGAGHAAHHLIQDRIRRSHQNAETGIQAFKARAAEEGVQARVIRGEGDPFALLTETWKTHDLCVLGLRGWFDHGIVDQPDNALLKLINGGVRPILGVSETHRPIRKVLVSYSGAMESAKAMKQFCQLRLLDDIALHILSVEDGHARAGSLVDDAAEYCRAHGFTVTTAIRTGKPSHVMLDEAAAQQCDALVMGSSHRQILLRQCFGSNVLHAVRNADIPIFLSH